MNDSSVLLDIAQPKQEGLSFRIFEAMKLEKKIITTNKALQPMIFMIPNNIFVWKNEDNIPSEDFFIKPFTPIPPFIAKRFTRKLDKKGV